MFGSSSRFYVLVLYAQSLWRSFARKSLIPNDREWRGAKGDTAYAQTVHFRVVKDSIRSLKPRAQNPKPGAQEPESGAPAFPKLRASIFLHEGALALPREAWLSYNWAIMPQVFPPPARTP